MTGMEVLRMIGAEHKSQLHKINQLSLTAWVAMAKELGVAMNDREHAAKILALRKLEAEGKLTQ